MKGGLDFRIEEHDSGRIRLRLEDFPVRLQQRLRQTIVQLTHELLTAVEAREPIRTGELRRLTVSFVDEKPGWIRGRVRVLRNEEGSARTAIAAGALEYGAPGKRRGRHKVFVQAHHRGNVSVNSFERRRPTIQAMRFLRGPALARLGRARRLLREDIENAWTLVK